MAFKIQTTENAQRDLDHIIEYIAVELANPSAASTLLDKVDKCCDDLSRMPYMYSECQRSRLKAMSYRKAILGNYIMVYRVDESTQTVYILRYFHGKQDYEKNL